MIKTLKISIKQDKEKYRVPRKVQDVIPISCIWPDGIFKVGNKFSQTFRFSDINYQVASREDKESMFLTYSELLNSLDSGAITKITINNRRMNKADFEDSILMPLRGDRLDEYRKEYNQMLLDKATGANGIMQEKYITVSAAKKDIEEARAYFARIGADLISHFAALGSKCAAMNAYQYRRVPAIDLAKKFIDEGSIGKILNVRCTYLQSWSADPASPLSWRFQKDIAGAGTLGDIASHVIDIAQYLAGDIEAVTGMMQTYITERPVQEGGTDLLGTVKLGADAKRKAVDVDDEDSFLVKFKNGAVGSIEATRNAWGRNNFITVELHGTLGSLYFNYERLNELQVCLAGDPDDRRGFKTIYTGPAHFHGEVTWNIPGMNIGYGELKSIESYEFIKAVIEGRQPSTSFAEGYRVERVCDAVKRSAETGRWVTVND